ncbi:condensation domain-containing protein [Nonomuraea sp. NPDC049400]|uniref:condensation domain-containing protein n=1 Tax=Nonomuraea sp. NPDC049400 TaxID=3364352 RepID=UPI0037980EC5
MTLDNPSSDDESSTVLMPQPCLIPFQDCSQRAGNIGWAQQVRWEYEVRGMSEDICFSADVPAGTTIDDFLSAIGRMVSRHESMRTRFQRVDGRLVRQEAVGSGDVDVIRYRVRAGHTPTDKLLRSRLGEKLLDIEKGFPFRAGFVAADGEVTHAAFAASSLIADAGACENVVSSFVSELSAIKNGANGRPERVFQQLDQVEWEASAHGLRADRQAMDYWREQMTAIQALPWPAILDSGTVRSFTVPAESVLIAADEVARTSGTSSSGVILTAFLQAAAQTLCLDGLGCYLHCSNRTGLGREASVTRLKNVTVYAYSPGSSDFRSAVREVFRDSLKAYRNAQSPGELFLSRLGLNPEEAPFIQFNDVRSVVAMDGLTGRVQQAEPRAEVDSDKPVMTETWSEITHHPAVLNLGVGAVMGASRKPILRFQTNLLRMDGISLLVERMNRVLAAA